MADKKEFTLLVNGVEKSTENVGKLVDNMTSFEQQTIKAISAQEILQSIIAANDPKKDIDKIIPAYQDLTSLYEHLLKMTHIGVKQRQEAYEIESKDLRTRIEKTKIINEADKKELDNIKKKEQALWKQRETLKNADEGRLRLYEKATDEQRKSLDENRENIVKYEKDVTDELKKNNEKRGELLKNSLQTRRKAIDDNYAEEIEGIKYKFKIEEIEIRNSTDLTLAAESEKTAYKERSLSDEIALTHARNTKLKDLEERRKAELKKAEQEYQKSIAGIVDNFIKERSTKLEVEVDTVSNKLTKSTKKTAKDLGEFFKGIDAETQKVIITESVKTQKAAKDATDAAKKEAAATKEATTAKTESATASKTATAATTQTTAATTAATAATKEATAATAAATDTTKKYIDIKATRANLKTEQEELKEMQKVLREKYDLQTAEYDKEIAAAGDNAEKRKEIENQKKEYTKQYGIDIIKLQQELNSAEKKEHDLSLTQWVQYAQKAEEVANSVKGVMTKVGDYLSTGFSAVSSVYKAEIAAIDEDIKQLAAKKAEADNIATTSATYLSNLKAEQAKAQEEGDTKLVKSLQERIDKEGGLLEEAKKNQRTYAIEQEELTRKKNKKAAEQEKIEKLNRKATLVKNIGEAIANVSQGVTKALAYGPFIGPVLAAVVAAAGAVQVGIMTKQLAKFEDGGLLKGKRHSQGGMRIEGTNMEVEGGEFIVNRVSTGKNLGLVKYINEQRRELTPNDLNTFFSRSSHGLEPSFKRMFAEGGQLPTVEPVTNIDNDSLIKAIQSIKIEPKVAVTDIHKVQDSMVSVSGWSGV